MDYKAARLDERLLVYCRKNGVDIETLDDPDKCLAVIEGDKLYIKSWNIDGVKQPTATMLRRILLTEVDAEKTKMMQKRRMRNPQWKVLKAICDKLELDMEAIINA